MTLREKLSDHKRKGESKRDPSITAQMHQATAELRASGIMDRVLKVGSKAPAFALPNAHDRVVNSVDLLRKGPLVVTFYRGHW